MNGPPIARTGRASLAAVAVAAFLAGRATSPEVDGAPTLAEALRDWLDADGDGSIGRYEAGATAMQIVDAFDEDRDGALDPDELADAAAWMESDEYEETVRLLERHDADGDDRLTRGEVPAAEAHLFEFADADDDGTLTRDELNDAFDRWNEDEEVDAEAEAAALLEEHDGDGDGRIARGEVEDGDDLAADFAFVDEDGDDALTRGELVRYVEVDRGSATFQVEGDVAVVTGTLDATTPSRVLELLLEHPAVRTLELRFVSGTTDDESNLWVMRQVRRRGLATHVPAGGMVASGGTDLLLAGARRTVAEGARVGVHSWDGGAVQGRDLPPDHEDHATYLAVCRELGVPEAYYWFTLEAAPADGMHWATREELGRYGIVTK